MLNTNYTDFDDKNRRNPLPLESDELEQIKGILNSQAENRKAMTAGFLRVVVDGEERAQIDAEKNVSANLTLDESAEFIEIYDECETLLANHLLSFGELEKGKQTQIFQLENGKKITFDLAPVLDNYGEVSEINLSIGLEKQEARRTVFGKINSFYTYLIAQPLLNLLSESNAKINEGVVAKLLRRESELENMFSAHLKNLTKILSEKSKMEDAEKLKIEIEKNRAEYEQVQAQIRATSRYATLTQPKTLGLKKIQTDVLDDDSVLLEYALGEEKSFLWIVSKNEFRLVELPDKEEVEKSVRAFYESLTARNKQIKFETVAERDDRIFIADSDARKCAKELSEKILAPAIPFLQNKRLLVVADGALQYVPFAALKISKTKNQRPKTRNDEQFLIETNVIVSLPSVSVLAVLRNETANRKTPSKTLAVLADPIFDKTDERFQTAG